MSFNLTEHLASLDHGQLARLMGDARLLELVGAVMQSRSNLATQDRGQLVLDLIGGPEALFDEPRRRKELFLTMSSDDRAVVQQALDVSNLERFTLTAKCRASLYALFGLAPSEKANARFSPAVSSIAVEYGLFPHQTAALLEAVHFLESNVPKVMLHMPTGSGKTRTAMHLICRHLNSRRGGLVVWLVSGRELCDQAAGEFRKAWRTLGERPLPLISAWEGRTAIDYDSFGDAASELPHSFEASIWPESFNDGVIIGSLSTIWGMMQRWEPGEMMRRAANVTLLVFDEAHRSAATTYAQVVGAITTGSGCGLLGLSATPGRSHYGSSSDDTRFLVDLFGGQMVQLSIPGFSSPVEGLIAQGYLARLQKERLTVAESGLSRAALRELSKRLESALDVPDETLKHIGLNAMRNLQVVERVERLVKEEGHRRVIVFAPSVESSNLMSSVLKTRGVASNSITSVTDPVVRADAIRRFLESTPRPMVLCNYGVLTTGFDAPSTSAVVIARPTLSIVLLNQMAGRAIRGPKVGGNKSALLVTVVDTTVPELVDTMNQFHAFDSSWEEPT